MLKLSELHTWLNRVEGDITGYVGSDITIGPQDKATAKESYHQKIIELKSAIDNYYSSMKSVNLPDLVLAVFTYLSWIPSDDLVDIREFFDGGGTFIPSLLTSDTRELFYDAGAVTPEQLIKLENFITKIKGAAAIDVAGINSAKQAMRSNTYGISFAAVFEVDADKKPSISVDIKQSARKIYNDMGIYDISKTFGIDVYIPSYIKEDNGDNS